MKERPEFVSIGIITKAHGIKGELLVIPITEDPPQFEKLKNISIKSVKEERKSFAIERVRIGTNGIILKLHGIDDRNSALALKGYYIDKRLDECEPLTPDEYYIFDLIGLEVRTTDNRSIGEVKEVLTLPANDVYVVMNGTREFLIPAIKDVVKNVDLENEVILIEPIDGLL